MDNLVFSVCMDVFLKSLDKSISYLGENQRKTLTKFYV